MDPFGAHLLERKPGDRDDRHRTKAAETVVGFVMKQAINRALGGPTSIVTGLHQTHMIFLSRVIRESLRTEEIWVTLREVERNLREFIAKGKALLDAIPARPEPPSGDLGIFFHPAQAEQLTEDTDRFRQGAAEAIEVLEAYLAGARDIAAETGPALEIIESKLQRGASLVPGLRAFSNEERELEIFGVREQIPMLRQQISLVDARLREYREATGLH